MRYAIFSDIHGNRPAWNAVLKDMRALEVDVFVCLGDIVGYGPKPQEVLDGIRSVTSNFVLGNHDAAAAGILDASIFNDQARDVIEWTRNQLNEETIQFLQEMPLVIEDNDVLFVHAEMEEPGRFHYIDSVEDARANFQAVRRRITFLGHTHNPGIFVENPDGSVQRLPDDDGILEGDSRYIINVGSVGEPRNPDDIRARYVIYDNDTHVVTFRRIEFDVEAYRAELRTSGLKVTPYFLQVVDHYQEALTQSQAAGAGHAMMVDMQTTSIRPATLSTETRQLVMTLPRAQMSRAKRKAAKNRSPLVVVISFTALLAAMVGAIIGFNPAQPELEERVVKEQEITIGSDAGGEGNSMVAHAVGLSSPDPPPSSLQPSPAIEPRTPTLGDHVLFDFEGNTFDGWAVEGTAFGAQPASVRVTARKAFSGQAGQQVAHSSHGGDGPTGKLTSAAFKVTHRYLRALVAGGPHQGQTYVGLEIDGKLVHSTTGQENLDFRAVLWDLSAFANKEAKFVAVDEHGGRWGVIAFDQVILTDEPGKLTPLP